MFENQERQVLRNFTTNLPKILDLKQSSGQIFPKIDVECPRVNSLSFCEGSQRVKLSFNGWPANKQEGGGGELNFLLSFSPCEMPPFSTITDLNRSSLTGYWKLEKFHLTLKQLLKRDTGADALLPGTSLP